MINRTLYFGNPAYLSTKLEQLIIHKPDSSSPTERSEVRIPIEDIGVLILDHPQITITQSTIAKLLENNVALITCDSKHHPTGLMLNLDGHSKQSKHFKHQIEASDILKKQLWQQTIKAKIYNQYLLLKSYGQDEKLLLELSKNVKSGDKDFAESQAAALYWKKLFDRIEGWTRHRFGEPPNHYLNYGYAILRAMVARNLVGSGLLPTLGIFHRNQYNAYCLADDIMEPYRPFVDAIVMEIIETEGLAEDITPDIKRKLLMLPQVDVGYKDIKRPLMLAVQMTTASLSKSFKENKSSLQYGTFL